MKCCGTVLSITTIGITLNKMRQSANDSHYNNTQHNGRVFLCLVSFMLCVTNKSYMLRVVVIKCHYAECRFADCHYAERCNAECHYAECCYDDCRGAYCQLF
jgi:hypothetical protein